MPNPTPSADDVRKALLNVVAGEVRGQQDGGFSRDSVINATVTALGQRLDGGITARLAMDAWDDLYRGGVVGYGMDRISGTSGRT
jgi:hypothetical protein